MICTPGEKGDSIKGLLKKIPSDRLILVSNSPAHTPQNIPDAFIRESKNEPSNMPFVVDSMASELGLSKTDMAKLLRSNTKAFYAIPEIEEVLLQKEKELSEKKAQEEAEEGQEEEEEEAGDENEDGDGEEDEQVETEDDQVGENSSEKDKHSNSQKRNLPKNKVQFVDEEEQAGIKNSKSKPNKKSSKKGDSEEEEEEESSGKKSKSKSNKKSSKKGEEEEGEEESSGKKSKSKSNKKTSKKGDSEEEEEKEKEEEESSRRNARSKSNRKSSKNYDLEDAEKELGEKMAKTVLSEPSTTENRVTQFACKKCRRRIFTSEDIKTHVPKKQAKDSRKKSVRISFWPSSLLLDADICPFLPNKRESSAQTSHQVAACIS